MRLIARSVDPVRLSFLMALLRDSVSQRGKKPAAKTPARKTAHEPAKKTRARA